MHFGVLRSHFSYQNLAGPHLRKIHTVKRQYLMHDHYITNIHNYIKLLKLKVLLLNSQRKAIFLSSLLSVEKITKTCLPWQLTVTVISCFSHCRCYKTFLHGNLRFPIKVLTEQTWTSKPHLCVHGGWLPPGANCSKW